MKSRLRAKHPYKIGSSEISEHRPSVQMFTSQLYHNHVCCLKSEDIDSCIFRGEYSIAVLYLNGVSLPSIEKYNSCTIQRK